MGSANSGEMIPSGLSQEWTRRAQGRTHVARGALSHSNLPPGSSGRHSSHLEWKPGSELDTDTRTQSQRHGFTEETYRDEAGAPLDG